ncbi:MAG: aminotransferase class V-fold PLP-dependent enzyme [Vallitalea sp.]|jgi:dTDP-4-amino-4,6-dideoxygalactose transaminase|nr:aminotransferase class V-fold PLP-dependent enzyme [Vallitalea sp.]
MSINLFMPTYRVEECIYEIKECLEKGLIVNKTIEFEEKWKKYTGLSNAHFLNSATAGLHLAIKIFKDELGWKDGDEIISSPLTFVSSNHAITYENLKVVFADVDKYLCLDPEKVREKITDKTRAVLYAGIGGNTGRYKDIVKLCKKYNLKLIVNGSHMSGTRLDGEIVGKNADVIVYSFQSVKNLPTADSGMICFRKKKYDDVVRKLSCLGINNKEYYMNCYEKESYKWKYDVEKIGYKYNGNPIMASIGLVQLKYLDQDNAYRRQIALWYDEAFKYYKNFIKPIPVIEDCESSRHLYIIEVNNRDELIKSLSLCEIYAGIHYIDNTEYEMYKYGKGLCPNAHRLSTRILSLPLHLRLTKDDVREIASKVIKFASCI